MVLIVYVHAGNFLSWQGEPAVYTRPFLLLADSGDLLFMTIAGYLLFRKDFTWLSNLKKKCKTILVPFVCWNIIWMVVESILHIWMPNQFEFSFFPLRKELTLVFGIPFWKDPFYMPFWFLLDLFFLNVLAPILKWFLKDHPILTILSICLLWFAPISYRIRIPFCFFLLGGFFALYPKMEEWIKGSNPWIWIGCSLISLVVGSIFFESRDMVSRIVAVICMGGLYSIVKCLENHPTCDRIVSGLLPYVIIVYALHAKPLAFLQSVYIRFFGGNSHLMAIGYFGLGLLVIVGSVLVGMALRKWMLSIFRVLVGYRENRKEA